MVKSACSMSLHVLASPRKSAFLPSEELVVPQLSETVVSGSLQDFVKVLDV